MLEFANQQHLVMAETHSHQGELWTQSCGREAASKGETLQTHGEVLTRLGTGPGPRHTLLAVGDTGLSLWVVGVGDGCLQGNQGVPPSRRTEEKVPERDFHRDQQLNPFMGPQP